MRTKTKVAGSATPAPALAGTRERLIRAAMVVLARGGIEAAPMRAIIKAAGSKHQSAVYYHFGDRWGLVEAVLDYAIGDMVSDQGQRMSAIEQGRVSRSVSAVFSAFVEPALTAAAGSNGRERLLFIARLLDEAGERGQAMVAQRVRPVAERAEHMLLQLLAHRDRSSISARLLYALNTLLHTLADRGMHRYWGLGQVPNEQLIRELMAFLEGGLRFDGGNCQR